mmetsp:Transcript_75909/g.216491  ORF Transcript_75909/g.216491 Transcript_75909/m.216491 type:complete len:269 (-) Transcript_75909:460-1266(-)
MNLHPIPLRMSGEPASSTSRFPSRCTAATPEGATRVKSAFTEARRRASQLLLFTEACHIVLWRVRVGSEQGPHKARAGGHRARAGASSFTHLRWSHFHLSARKELARRSHAPPSTSRHQPRRPTRLPEGMSSCSDSCARGPRGRLLCPRARAARPYQQPLRGRRRRGPPSFLSCCPRAATRLGLTASAVPFCFRRPWPCRRVAGRPCARRPSGASKAPPHASPSPARPGLASSAASGRASALRPCRPATGSPLCKLRYVGTHCPAHAC